MGAATGIEWTDHTWSPWIGCTRLSAACDHCYAADLARRWGGPRYEAGAPRRRTSEQYWKHLARWNRKAEAAGRPAKVFPSLCDPFDAEVDPAWRADHFAAIDATPWLIHLLLTKRPQMAKKWAEEHPLPDNVWLGVTAENQAMADLRIPVLLSIAAKVRFLSCEPLLSRIFVPRYGVHWIIGGGESGPHARPCHPDWARSLRDQCQTAGIAFFWKQWGEWLPGENYTRTPSEIAQWQDGATGQHPTARNKPHSKVPEWRHFGEVGTLGAFALKVGKKAAGATLDGREWREFPAP